MNIGERLACVETKLKTIEKLIYFLVLAVGANAGIDLIPFITAFG